MRQDRFTPVGVLIDNCCTPVVSWAVDGRELVFAFPGIFLVLVVRSFWDWPGCSGVNLECLKCDCLWLNVDVGLSII